MRVYVTEISTWEEAKLAIKSGASAIGIRIGYGKGDVHPEKAREIFLQVPLFVSRVGIFANEKRYHVQEITTFCQLNCLHFWGNEIPEDTKRYNEHLIKTFNINDFHNIESYTIEAVSIVIKDMDSVNKIKYLSEKLLIINGDFTFTEWKILIDKFEPYAVQISQSNINTELIQMLVKY
jgi:phosphoribosylanthranilate isomerase